MSRCGPKGSPTINMQTAPITLNASSKPGLDLTGQSAKITDTLQFVIGQFDVEVILQLCEQVECLKAVNAEGFEKVFIRGQLIARDFEMSGGEVKNFVKRLIGGRHNFSGPSLRQIGLSVRALNELLQASPDCRALKEFTKDVN